jgi:putative addiction module component (TIGR02574 family)
MFGPREVARDAAELPPPERLKLTRILLDLSEEHTGATEEVQAAWDQEIERRLQELRTGQTKGVPLEDVKKKIKAQFCS